MTSPTHHSVINRKLSPLSAHQPKHLTSAFWHPSDEEEKEEKLQDFYSSDEDMEDLLKVPPQ